MLTAQTGSALVRILLCLASLIEDLLGRYDFVLTSRFQSDPLEKRFGQLRDVTSSEKIIKIKSLRKEGLDIDNVKVENANDDETTSRLLCHTGIVSCPVSISDDSREVAVHIAGYLAKKLKKTIKKLF